MARPAITEHEGKKYLRRIFPAAGTPDPTNGEGILVDVYEVLEAFEVLGGPRTQAVKKLLATGRRGKGDELADLVGALAALNRDIDLVERRQLREPAGRRRVPGKAAKP